MSALILELKQGESMILNGAVIRFKTRTRLELSTQARILIDAHRIATTSPSICDTLEQMLAILPASAGFEALKLARQIIREETAHPV